MVDRLIGVCGEFAAGSAEVLVEVDAGAEREDAGGDAGEQSGGGAATVLSRITVPTDVQAAFLIVLLEAGSRIGLR